MANIKYVLKDPSFKYFIIGLVLFVAITGGGILAVKKLVNDKTTQKEELAVVDESKKPDNVVVIDDSKPAPTQDQGATKPSVGVSVTPDVVPAPAVTTPTELSRTGADSLLSVLGLAAVTYVVVLAVQKRQ